MGPPSSVHRTITKSQRNCMVCPWQTRTSTAARAGEIPLHFEKQMPCRSEHQGECAGGCFPDRSENPPRSRKDLLRAGTPCASRHAE
jgi:hypothetical protein